MFLELSIGRFDCKITTDSNIRKWGQFTENPPEMVFYSLGKPRE